jgi:DNA-3-methyladenine glycosylase II
VTQAQIEQASAYLKQTDPVLGVIIEQIDLAPIEPTDPWWELVDSITSQQLSVKAAATILGRLEALLGGKKGPDQILKLGHEELRSVGLSNAKARYVRDLAGRVQSGEIGLDHLPALSDEDVIATLTAVKGIGRWTAEMFLIFHLGRPDVLPVDDLGFREAAKRLYDLSERPDAQTLTELGERWRPYRSVATRYLWKSLTLELPTDAKARPV